MFEKTSPNTRSYRRLNCTEPERMNTLEATRLGMEETAATLVAPLRHPELESLGTESIRRFVKKRKAYERTLEEADQQKGTTSHPVSLMFSIKQDLLEDIVDLGPLGDELVDVKFITDQIIQEWLKKHENTKKASWALGTVDS